MFFLRFKFSVLRLERGHLLIELVIAIGLLAIILPALVGGLFATRESGPQQQMRLKATALLKETESAVRFIKDNDWATFVSVTHDTPYHPEVSVNSWVLVSGTTTTASGLTQSVVVRDVYREDGDIVATGGTLDPSTKQVDITISWTVPQTSSVTSTLYFTRSDNLTYSETTEAVFDAGTNTGTAVVATNGTGIADDGQIQLGAGGGADWCTPSLSITSLDLPGQGITTAISAVEGRAYMTTGGNSSGDSMDAVSITDTAPPVATNFSAYNNRKTYDVYTDGNYSYLTSDHPSMTVDIVQVTSTPYSSVGTFVASGGGTGNSVYVSDNVGFVTAGSYLYSFDLTSKTGTRPQYGRVALNGTGLRVMVIDDYAYVVTNNTTNQLQIINISNPSNMSVVSSFSMNNNQAGTSMFVSSSGTYIYLTTNYIAGRNNFFTIDATDKAAPIALGSYSTNGMSPKGVLAVPGNRAIVVGSGGEQYQVFDVSNLSSPVYCGGLSNINSSTSVNAVTAVTEDDGDVYAYILTNNSSSEFQIIEGGPGGQFSMSGNFESATFDPSSVDGGTSPRSFNRFVASVSEPALTTIRMQAAVAAAGGGGDCTGVTYSFVGPDGTDTSYFTPDGDTITGLIPLQALGSYQNPGRCFRYKVFLDSSDITQTPIFRDIILNYSP